MTYPNLDTAAVLAWPKQSWFVRGPLLSAIAIIASVAALCVEAAVMGINGEHVLGYLGIALSALGLFFTFRARWAALGLTAAGALVSILFSTEYVGIWSVVVFTLFLFARQGKQALIALATVASPLYIALVSRGDWHFDDPVALVVASFCVGAAAAGSAVRLQTEAWEAARQRAAELAREQDAHLQQAVADERLRIARDLHDVLGHELAVVNINVGVAEVSLASNVSAVPTALKAAREGLQRTMIEIQQILDLLRDENSDVRTELAVLENIPALVNRITTAGSDVRADVEIPLPAVDPDVSTAAYRIVQEALTNAGKHGAGPVELRVHGDGRLLHLQITNRTASRAGVSARQGYGLVGMRERALSAGGALETTDSDGRFEVHATLPLRLEKA